MPPRKLLVKHAFRKTKSNVEYEFIATERQQLDEIASLVQASFHLASNHPSLDRRYLSWKYYEPGPDWPGSRSYVLADGGRFLAHASVWPITLRIGSTVRAGIGFCDWAADEARRGIGLMLLTKLVSLSSFTLATGGSDITRQILPRMRFKHWADRAVYARVLRPFQQQLTRMTTGGWKAPGRLARNILWSVLPNEPALSWVAREDEPDHETLSIGGQEPGPLHSVPFIRFLLTCPSAKFRYFRLLKNGAARGYALISEVRGQARIAAVRIAPEAQPEWNAVISALLGSLKDARTVFEVIAFGSTPLLDQALLANGFHLRDWRPMVIFDPEDTIARQPVPQLGMLEDDASYLNDPRYRFMT